MVAYVAALDILRYYIHAVGYGCQPRYRCVGRPSVGLEFKYVARYPEYPLEPVADIIIPDFYALQYATVVLNGNRWT